MSHPEDEKRAEVERPDPALVEVEELTWNVLDGSATEDQHARLETLLTGNDRLQQCYISICDLHFEFERRALSEEMAGSSDESENEEPSPVTPLSFLQPVATFFTQPIPFSLGIAALVVGGILAISALIYPPSIFSPSNQSASTHSPSTHQPIARQIKGVAELSKLTRVTWDKSVSHPRGRRPRLKVGQRLKVESGEVLVVYDTGARVTLEGPSDYTVLGNNDGQLQFGKLLALVKGKSAQGFAVETPKGKVTDLGTKFGVGVQGDFSTRIDVFKGMVDFEAHDSSGKPGGNRTRLVAGKALTIDGVNGSVARVPADRSLYIEDREALAELSQPIIKTFKAADQMAFASDVSKSDLLHGIRGTHTGWKNLNGARDIYLNDGAFGGDFDEVGEAALEAALDGAAWAADGNHASSSEFELGRGAGRGYNLTSITSIAAWNGAGFMNQKYRVSVRRVGEKSFSPLANVNYQPFDAGIGTAGATKIVITGSEDVLAEGVEAIKFSVLDTNSNSGGGAVFHEIDVQGTGATGK